MAKEIKVWWICTDRLHLGGEKIMGPFLLKDTARDTRTRLEQLTKPKTYWIDSQVIDLRSLDSDTKSSSRKGV
jgi:hypothetical protein